MSTFTILFTTDIILSILCALIGNAVASIIMGAAAVVTVIVFARYRHRQLRECLPLPGPQNTTTPGRPRAAQSS